MGLSEMTNKNVEEGIRDTKLSLENLRQNPSSGEKQKDLYRKSMFTRGHIAMSWMDQKENYDVNILEDYANTVREGIELIQDNPNPLPSLPEKITREEFDRVILEFPGIFGSEKPSYLGSWFYLMRLKGDSAYTKHLIKNTPPPKPSFLKSVYYAIMDFITEPTRRIRQNS